METKSEVLMSKSSPQDMVSVNLKFKSQQLRLTIPIPVMEEVVKKEKVENNRKFAVES